MKSIARVPSWLRRTIAVLWAVAATHAVPPVSGQRIVELPPPSGTRVGFVARVPAATGLHFTNPLAEARHLTNQIHLNGSGVAAGDVDGDGWCDLYFCSLDAPNALFRNRGNWTFEDITARAGVAGAELDATGAAFADLDGDADLDLVLNSIGGGTHCFFNDGQGRFGGRARNPGMNARQGGTSLAFGDVDNDGDLDLYVANYRTVTIRDQPNTRFAFRVVNGRPSVTAINGRPLTDPDLTNRFDFNLTLGDGSGSFSYEENGEPDVLYLNDGAGRFVPVPFTGGRFLDPDGQPLKQPPLDWGLSVMFRDLNGDCAPDLYVCNDFRSPDRIWLNDGRGRFRALPRLAIRQSCLSSMGMDVADVNRDGWDDLFVLDMLSREHGFRLTQRIDVKPEVQPVGAVDNRPQFSRNMLYLNRGDGTFAELAQFSGLEAAEWSWMPVFLDVDLDGYEDVLIPNGFERDNMNVDALRELQALKKQQRLTPAEQLRLRKLFPRLATANLAYRNLGNLRFAEMGAAWGFDTVGISQGLALADLDNDGDLDLAVNNLNGAATLYQNVGAAPRVAVRLKGRPPNTRGIGSKIRLLGGPVPQSQEMIAGGRYLSGDEALRVFACGEAQGGMTIEVTWRSGWRSVVRDVKPNRLYEVAEASALPPLHNLPPTPPPLPHFRDASALLGHRHHDEPFDDFAVQPMLPKRLSQAGPGVAWFDLDHDGWDDLIIGSGRGGRMAVFRNNGQGAFDRLPDGPWAAPQDCDQTGLVGWRHGQGRTVLLAGADTYEDGLTNQSGVRAFDGATEAVAGIVPGHPASTGPLALADVDGDGDLDLFVGGRAARGRYPLPVASRMFHAGPMGALSLDERNSRLLADIGPVNGAVFSDLDGDGDPDLVAACEWGPIRVFVNEQGQFTDGTRDWGLAEFAGWWNGVTTGDFDGDGRLDIAAANWGRNSKYEYYRHQDLAVFAGDTDGNGTVEIVEAYFNPAMQQWAPIQPYHLVVSAMPLVGDRLRKCATYARLTLDEIYGAALKPLVERRVNWLDSTVFLNRGGRFAARPLPREAQWAPAFAVNAADLDGDGREDLFLSQNFFAVPPETSRYDAGRGLWLRGDGQGGFTAVAGQTSGIRVYGEQRGAAVGDYDADGRVDVVVSQNAAETKLYRNVGARPGLRVRLSGLPGNPEAIGACLRLGTPVAWGPVRELHAGAGYWSQDSAVPVLARVNNPTHLWVRWPGGNVTTSSLPSAAKEIQVSLAGDVTVAR